ncbi:MAG: thiamine diphosphokinase [Traorella sp.]
MNKKCIIVGAGDFFEEKIDVSKDDFVIAADGGYAYCTSLGLIPHLVVADFDSYQGKVDNVEIIQSIPEKDDTDMMLAIIEGLKRDYHEFVIYGGLGGRIEHSLGNIQCLHYLAKHGAHGKLISKDCCIEVVKEGKYCYEYRQGYISLFSLGDKVVVTLKNFKYPLNHYELNNYTTLGVDNEFLMGNGIIEVHEGSLCIVMNKE